jgi:hypothetical protein
MGPPIKDSSTKCEDLNGHVFYLRFQASQAHDPGSKQRIVAILALPFTIHQKPEHSQLLKFNGEIKPMRPFLAASMSIYKAAYLTQ